MCELELFLYFCTQISTFGNVTKRMQRRHNLWE